VASAKPPAFHRSAFGTRVGSGSGGRLRPADISPTLSSRSVLVAGPARWTPPAQWPWRLSAWGRRLPLRDVSTIRGGARTTIAGDLAPSNRASPLHTVEACRP
jgi:hypothetical protein